MERPSVSPLFGQYRAIDNVGNQPAPDCRLPKLRYTTQQKMRPCFAHAGKFSCLRFCLAAVQRLCVQMQLQQMYRQQVNHNATLDVFKRLPAPFKACTRVAGTKFLSSFFRCIEPSSRVHHSNQVNWHPWSSTPQYNNQNCQ